MEWITTAVSSPRLRIFFRCKSLNCRFHALLNIESDTGRKAVYCTGIRSLTCHTIGLATSVRLGVWFIVMLALKRSYTSLRPPPLHLYCCQRL